MSLSISNASSVYPGAITPSLTSRLIRVAVAASQMSLSATKSPYEHMRSAPLARAYAHASGDSSIFTSSTKYILFRVSLRGSPIAAPAGLTCLKLAAAGMPVAALSSFTSCQLFRASRKLIYPGRPLITSMGSSPSSMNILDGFWLGLHPYFKANSFITVEYCLFNFLLPFS